jgi:hypothetical protein
MRALATLLLLLAPACGGAPPNPPPGDQVLALGTLAPDGGYLPLVDGQDATLVEGAQGGFHVWMKFLLPEPSPMHVHVSRTAHRASDGQLVLRSTGTLDIPEMPPGMMWESPDPTPMFMCPSPVGIRVVDESIVFEVGFSDDSGAEVAHGSVTLVPRCPDAQLAFCMRICTG